MGLPSNYTCKNVQIAKCKANIANMGKAQQWEHFSVFIRKTYEETLVAGHKIKCSIVAYIHLYHQKFPELECPSKSQAYNWINDHKYGLMCNFFPYMLQKVRHAAPKV